MSILIQLSLLMSNRDNARVHNQNWVREEKKESMRQSKHLMLMSMVIY